MSTESERNTLRYGGLNIGLAQVLRDQLQSFNDGIAIEQGEYIITFRELHYKAIRLMNQIRTLQTRKEEPIGILAPRGINHILCQVAVVYAGGSCVPLDVDFPDSHITNLLRNLNASIVLTDAKNQERLPGYKHIVVDHASPRHINVETDTSEVSANGPMCCSHIFHTSGSTGKPKAVQVLAVGVMNLVFNDFDAVRRGHRLGHVCNIGFDVSVWEIWSALLHGATIVVFERNEVLDPGIFERRLCNDRIDVMWQTTSLLATMAHACPQVYSNVYTLLTGGEAINIQTIRTIFANGPPKRLFNVYGPTELTVFTTYHRVTPEEVQKGIIPIGRPLRNYEAFVVDENLQPVPNGMVGELLVGGAGVAAGYFGNPEKTSAAFISVPGLFPTCKTSTGLLYRTGDLVRRNHAGEIEYIGRRDNEVKIRGQRVELESIEVSLLETKLVSAAVALKVEPEEPEVGSELLALVIPASADIESGFIREAYVKVAPQLMIPRIKVVESLALTQSGKADRKRLAREYTDQLQSMRKAREQSVDKSTNCIESRLRRLWLDILGLPVDHLKNSDDFFFLGGTSLQAAMLVSKIQQSLGATIRVAALFENSTLERMCDLVSRARNGVQLRDSTTEMAAWLKDCELGSDIRVISGTPPVWHSDSEGRVFLTGATGFVGSFFLARLLAIPQVKTVACLVRAENQVGAVLRIREVLRRYGLSLEPKHEAKILAVPGDFSRSDLGLGLERYQHFAEWSSVVFHLGAHINYVQPYSSHRAANVLGTLHMIQFSNTKRPKQLHYTSSISAYGPAGVVTGSKHLAEDERPANHINALLYDTGYAQSQCVAETIAWNAIENGLHLTIHRLGVVLGHSETGATNQDDFFGRVMASCIRKNVYPLLPRHREDIVPVDFVVSALLHIASESRSHARAYNLVHPDPGAVDLGSLFRSINRLAGKSTMREVPYAEWLAELSRKPDANLLSLMPMLEEKVFGERSRWEMQQDLPEFGTDNLRRSLDNCSEALVCPSRSALLATYLPRWLEAASE